jgi:hypothetical protein
MGAWRDAWDDGQQVWSWTIVEFIPTIAAPAILVPVVSVNLTRGYSSLNANEAHPLYAGKFNNCAKHFTPRT